jgi:H+/Cl- antiporter ClcA
MVSNAPLKGTVLMMEELDREEIKRIKSALRSVPFDAALDLYPLMHPDDGFIEIVSTPTPPPFPLGFLCFLSIA